MPVVAVVALSQGLLELVVLAAAAMVWLGMEPLQVLLPILAVEVVERALEVGQQLVVSAAPAAPAS